MNVEILKEGENIQNYMEKINKNIEDNSDIELDQLKEGNVLGEDNITPE